MTTAPELGETAQQETREKDDPVSISIGAEVWQTGGN